MTTDSDDLLTSHNRKEYQEDPFKWLHKRFLWVNQRISSQSEWQANQTKEFAQEAAESLARKLMRTRYSLILWLGLMVIVSLASAGLWVGAGVVAIPNPRNREPRIVCVLRTASASTSRIAFAVFALVGAT